MDFAAATHLSGSADDPNAQQWHRSSAVRDDRLEGAWGSRWNGGADATIPGDRKELWKRGNADVRVTEDRVYILFTWGDDARRGLLDARLVSADTLVGRYVNLNDPTITQPWVGLIVDNGRIDGRFPLGRLDFRR